MTAIPTPCLGALALLCLFGTLTNGAERPPSATAPAGKPIVYKKSGGADQIMEVYFPANHDPKKSRVPAVLFFHGGGWAGGNLKQFRYACDYFAKRGLVAATANYQMLPKEQADKNRKRVCITDAKSALRWMKQHAADLGIDPERIVTGGGSAGGHLSVMASYCPELDDPADPKGIDTSVRAHLLFNAAFLVRGREKDPVADVFNYVKPGMAPMIFFFGDKDGWKQGTDQLLPELRKAGNRATLWVGKDVGHSFWMKQPWYDLCLAESDRFLVSLGLLSGETPLRPTTEGIVFTRQDRP